MPMRVPLSVDTTSTSLPISLDLVTEPCGPSTSTSPFLDVGGGAATNVNTRPLNEEVFCVETSVLCRLFPEHVVERLNRGEAVPAESFRHVCVLFADIIGFTEVSHQLSAMEVHKLLENYHSVLDPQPLPSAVQG